MPNEGNPFVPPPVADIEFPEEKQSKGWMKWGIIGGVAAIVIFGLIIWGLYSLGNADSSALERFRDIAVIFIIFLFMITVILLAAVVAALAFLVLQTKDKVIPLLEEISQTVRRVRGTTEFMTEEAVKPLIAVAGTYAKLRAMGKSVTRGPKKGSKFSAITKKKH
jgi:hypothetical protein